MNIPIVQGVAVDNNKYQATNDGVFVNNESTAPGTQPQQRRCNDVIWAVLFIVQLVVMLAILSSNIVSGGYFGGGEAAGGTTGLILFCGAMGSGSVVLSVAAFGFLKSHAESLVKAGLIFSVGFSLAMAVLGFMVGSMMMGIFGLISFAIGVCYAYAVWSRIPFAAVNLQTAVTAVQANMGLLLLSGLCR